ncbi:LysR family transcriptional regulator [Arthrobacter mangrovi]|uniref:LysR family transcriptional regulator n=1 Tax=Arthrobacter mangrovi TaxID=2966350 RepID=A0ABQ5N044_9MICC|nr:LysR family transcriptional regulator [Arthrobacter mangrovi]GLB69555.1 LysR family transcriptional regulator [Arthrobacter mangrovi]
MERRQLEYFLAVVDTGNVSAAALELHVTQPTISVALRTLEKELGGQLFSRSPTGLTLTATGQALVEPARQVLRDFSVAHERVRDVLGLAGGHLDIGAVPALASGWLMDFIVAFRKTHPEVGVRVHAEIDDETIAAQVRSGRYNLGLTVTQPTVLGLETRSVGHQTLQALMPPGTADRGEPVEVTELAVLDFVCMHRDRSISRRWFEQELSQRNLAPRVRIELGTPDGILPLVEAGAGFALWWTPMSARTGDCVLRPIRPELRRPIMLSHREGVLSPAAEAFLDIVAASDAKI